MLLESCDPRHGRGGFLRLSGAGGEHKVSVALRSGRIIASVDLPGIGHLHGNELILDSALPESVAGALVGRTLGDLVDHPMLCASTKIASVTSSEPNQMLVRLRTRYRPIPTHGIHGGRSAA